MLWSHGENFNLTTPFIFTYPKRSFPNEQVVYFEMYRQNDRKIFKQLFHCCSSHGIFYETFIVMPSFVTLKIKTAWWLSIYITKLPDSILFVTYRLIIFMRNYQTNTNFLFARERFQEAKVCTCNVIIAVPHYPCECKSVSLL